MNVFKSVSARSSLVAGMAALLLAGILPGCGGSPESRPKDAPMVQGLRLETARLENVADEIPAPGSVIARSTAQVAARTMGTVTQVTVREGDLVKRGQLLAQLDERELAARRTSARAGAQEASAGVVEASRGLALAQAQADIAAKTYERYVYLRDQKSVSPQEFDEVEVRQRGAQAGLEQAKARLQQAEAGKTRAESEARAAEEVAGYARVTAPFEGRVLRRMIEPGSLITPGTPLFLIEDLTQYQIEVTLAPEALTGAPGASAAIRRGSLVRVELDGVPGKVFSGKVAELEAGADPSTHTLQARIDLPRDPAIQSGLFGRAWLRRGERRALVVAASAIVERGQLRGVYAADASGAARWRVITLGQKIGERVEVLSGLSDGEQVVANPGMQELDGKRVATAPAIAGEKKP